MRLICVLVGLLVLTFLPARAGHSPPKIFLRIHVQTTGEGLSPLEATPIPLPPNGEQILVRTMPEITEQNLIGVDETAAGVVRFQFNHQGQVALNAVTAQNQGRILVVLLNGVVIYAPIIDQQINSGELDVPRPLNPQIIALLQEVAKKNLRQAAKT